MSRITCEICDDPRPTVYEPKNEGHYCVSCHENMMSKIKNFKIYTSEDRVLVANSLETALEILENNGYIVEVEYENG